LQEAAERKHNVVGDEIFNMIFGFRYGFSLAELGAIAMQRGS
jgi:hypothetical protein